MSATVLSALLSITMQAHAESLSSDRIAVGIPTTGDLQGELVELTAEGGSFLAIFQARQRDEHRGGIVLLHDQGTRANSLEVIRPLRLGLAEAGWDTLSLQLPPAWQSGESRIQARLRAGLDWLKARKPPGLAVIAQGSSGMIALAYASTRPPPELQALVLVSMPAAATGGADALSQVRLPVLDLYAERDHGPVLQGAAARKHAAGGDNRDYTQTAIAGATAGFFGLEDSLLGRIRGWLAVKTAAQAAGPD